jgi:hypothetical protein
MPEGSRPSRVSEEFREIIAEEIPKLKEPRVGVGTVTGVCGPTVWRACSTRRWEMIALAVRPPPRSHRRGDTTVR